MGPAVVHEVLTDVLVVPLLVLLVDDRLGDEVVVVISKDTLLEVVLLPHDWAEKQLLTPRPWA